MIDCVTPAVRPPRESVDTLSAPHFPQAVLFTGLIMYHVPVLTVLSEPRALGNMKLSMPNLPPLNMDRDVMVQMYGPLQVRMTGKASPLVSPVNSVVRQRDTRRARDRVLACRKFLPPEELLNQRRRNRTLLCVASSRDHVLRLGVLEASSARCWKRRGHKPGAQGSAFGEGVPASD
jgi:hypothetical protein